MKKISFISAKQTINGTLITPQHLIKKVSGVIFFHGMTSSEKNYIPIAQRLSEYNIAGLTLNMRGHGTSEGSFDELTVNDAVDDGVNAYDFLTQYNFIDKERIGICGASVGAAIASLVTSKRNVKSLALRVPATYTNEMMNMTFNSLMNKEGKIFNQMQNPTQTPALKAIKKFKGSLLVIVSGNDSIIPISITSQFLLNAKHAFKRELAIIKDATHNLAEDKWKEEFRKLTVDWFTKTL